MKLILVSLLALLILLAMPLTAIAVGEDGIDIKIEPLTREAMIDITIRDKFFRAPLGVLWTYFGEDSRSYAIQMRHGFISNEVLPNPFSQLGLIPTAIVGDITYESNPSGETGDAVWSKATAYYDNLFDFDYLEGRVIYNDIKLDSFLGAGIGYVPVHNSWVGGYYLGSEGFMFSAEAAKAIDERFWLYGDLQYYVDNNEEWEGSIEGEIGIVFDDLIYAAVQNREDEFIYMIGVSHALN